MLSFLWLFSGLSLADDPGKTEVTITDDGWVEVPLDFTFPFYNQNYVTSFMFSNGVIGFMNPNSIPGTGISNDGLCCNSYDFSTTSYDAMGNYGGVRFDYVIMPWHTDLIDIGTGKFYIQGDTTFQSYFWENISEYYDNTNLNTFDTTIYPTGNIKFAYQAIDIQSHSVSVALIGDLSAGQYTQWFYNNPSTDGGVYWTSGNTVPIEISGGQSICDVDSTASYVCTFFAVGYAEEVYSNACSASALYDPGCPGYTTAYTTQQCGISTLYNSACPGYATAYFNQQCSLDAIYDPSCTGYETAYLDNQCVLDSTYSPYCSGYSIAIAEEENEYDYEEAYEDDFTYEEELIEDTYIPEIEYENFFDFQPEIVDTNDYMPEFQTYETFTPEVEITTYETTIAEVFIEIETQMMEEFDDFSMDMFEDFPMPEMDMSEPLEEIMMMDDFPPMMEDFSTEMQVDDFANTMEDFPEMLEMPEIEQEVELAEQEELTEEIMPEPELEQEPEPGDQEMLTEEPVEEETVEEEVIEEIEEVEEVEEAIEEEEPEIEPEEEIEEEIEEEAIEEDEENDEPLEEEEEESEGTTDEEADEESEESDDGESNDEEESEEVLEPEAEEEVEEVVVESKIKEPTAAEKKKAKQAKLREIITSKLKSLAVEMGEAASLAEQQELQNFIIALLNFNLGFNSYNSSMIDGTFYDNRDIYINMKVPENQRGLRNGLANQILHNKLVDIQYEEDYGRSRIQGD